MLICALPIIGRVGGPTCRKKQERRFLSLCGAAALKTSARFAAGQGVQRGKGLRRGKVCSEVKVCGGTRVCNELMVCGSARAYSIARVYSGAKVCGGAKCAKAKCAER